MPGTDGAPGGLRSFGCGWTRGEAQPPARRVGAGSDSAVSSPEADEPEPRGDRRESWANAIPRRPASKRARRDLSNVRRGEDQAGDREVVPADGGRRRAPLHSRPEEHRKSNPHRNLAAADSLRGRSVRLGKERVAHRGIDLYIMDCRFREFCAVTINDGRERKLVPVHRAIVAPALFVVGGALGAGRLKTRCRKEVGCGIKVESNRAEGSLYCHAERFLAVNLLFTDGVPGNFPVENLLIDSPPAAKHENPTFELSEDLAHIGNPLRRLNPGHSAVAPLDNVLAAVIYPAPKTIRVRNCPLYRDHDLVLCPEDLSALCKSDASNGRKGIAARSLCGGEQDFHALRERFRRRRGGRLLRFSEIGNEHVHLVEWNFHVLRGRKFLLQSLTERADVSGENDIEILRGEIPLRHRRHLRRRNARERNPRESPFFLGYFAGGHPGDEVHHQLRGFHRGFSAGERAYCEQARV